MEKVPPREYVTNESIDDTIAALKDIAGQLTGFELEETALKINPSLLDKATTRQF